MSDTKLDSEACLALMRDGAEVPAACTAILEAATGGLTAREEGALILFAVLIVVVLGHFLLQASSGRRRRLEKLRKDI